MLGVARTKKSDFVDEERRLIDVAGERVVVFKRRGRARHATEGTGPDSATAWHASATSGPTSLVVARRIVGRCVQSIVPATATRR